MRRGKGREDVGRGGGAVLLRERSVEGERRGCAAEWVRRECEVNPKTCIYTPCDISGQEKSTWAIWALRWASINRRGPYKITALVNDLPRRLH